MITVKTDNRIYINGNKSNFFIYEFVAPEIWDKWGQRSIRYIEEAIIVACQLLRDETGLPITVCNYKTGGTYRDSGTRVLESYKRLYASKSKAEQTNKYLKTYSMHKFAGAADLKIGDLTSEQMAKWVSDLEPELLEIGIKRIENPEKTKSKHGKLGRDWLHIDTAITGLNYIIKVNP